MLDQQIRYLEWHLGNEVGRRWWAQYKVEEPEDEIVRMIDKVLSTTDYDQNRRYVEALMKSEPAQVKPD